MPCFAGIDRQQVEQKLASLGEHVDHESLRRLLKCVGDVCLAAIDRLMDTLKNELDSCKYQAIVMQQAIDRNQNAADRAIDAANRAKQETALKRLKLERPGERFGA